MGEWEKGNQEQNKRRRGSLEPEESVKDIHDQRVPTVTSINKHH